MARLCKDGTLDMRFAENRGMDKYGGGPSSSFNNGPSYDGGPSSSFNNEPSYFGFGFDGGFSNSNIGFGG